MGTSTVGLLYDFDKTLCTMDMQEYTFIPKLKMTADEFWSETTALATKSKMDSVLTYMYLMLEKAKQKGISIQREDFVELGRHLEFFPGVKTWFTRINEYAQSLGLSVEHYIISSGLREIIEGSEIMQYFKEVFACEFLYDKAGNACWPKNAVNYTTKTQFLFRISKGALDLSDDVTVNQVLNKQQLAIPLKNIIYIADGITDIPCMKLVKSHGGYSIAVYKDAHSQTIERLLADDRVNFAFSADYRPDSQLEKTVQCIIGKIQLEDQLQSCRKL